MMQSRMGPMIAWTAVFAVMCWGATLYMVRAIAQEPPPPVSAEPPVEAAPAEATTTIPGADSNEEDPAAAVRGAAPAAVDELPEFRDSADNNISLPVDI